MGISSTVFRLLLLAVTAIPVTPADTRREIDRLVGQLGHAEYSVRENALKVRLFRARKRVLAAYDRRSTSESEAERSSG